jgi:hypothetical protein
MFFTALRAEMGQVKGFTCSFTLAQNSALHMEAETRKICWHMLRPLPCRLSFASVGSSRVVFWAQLHQPVLPVGLTNGGLHQGMVQPQIIGSLLAKDLSIMFVTGEVHNRVLYYRPNMLRPTPPLPPPPHKQMCKLTISPLRSNRHQVLVMTPLGAMPTEWSTPPLISDIFATDEAKLENTTAFMGLNKV